MGAEVSAKCIHLENESHEDFYGAVSFPIFQSAAFAHPGVGSSTGYDYSRPQNPTRKHLERSNVACPRATLEKALTRLEQAIGGNRNG